MRTSAFVGTSLDGFLARRDGSFDFLTGGSDADGASNGFDAFFATVDAVLMGRNTYDVVLAMPRWFYGTTPVFVLSRRPLPPARERTTVERLSGAPAAVLADLAARGFRHVYVDGGLTIQQFLRAGLHGLPVEPVGDTGRRHGGRERHQTEDDHQTQPQTGETDPGLHCPASRGPAADPP